jgi:bifunctional DNA primase/polymerase-like protein
MSRDLNRDWALRYAEIGISVFPCAADDKRPLIRWRSGSTTNTGRIVEIWNQWPGSLVGIDLHKCGLVVFDADRHNVCADGVTAFAALLREHDTDLSAVPITHTPGNGFHFYFRQPDQLLSNREGDLPAGVNVRGSGGFAIAPFCVRPDGKSYRNVAGRPSLITSFKAGTIPTVPDWLIEIVRKSTIWVGSATAAAEAISVSRGLGSKRERAWAVAALQCCITDLANCPTGHRNNHLNAISYRLGRIVSRGWLDRNEVANQLQAAAYDCGLIADDGIRAVHSTIASGLNAGINQPVADLRERGR